MAVFATTIAIAVPAYADLSDPGPYPAGWTTVTVTRANATTFTARLFYPATAPGQATTFDPSGGPYPAITFGHGFLQAVSQYQSTCSHLATRGYLVIAPESESGLTPNHAGFAADLSRGLTFLEQENARAGSPYFGRVNTAAFGMSGHSMGGGASVLAASTDVRVGALITMAAAETTPSAVTAASALRVPTSFICGSAETIVPPSSNGQLMYNATTAPRQLPLITGGFHCGFTDAAFPFCDSGTITRATQLADTRALITAFFDLNLNRDQTVWQAVWGPSAPPPPASGGVVATLDAAARLTPSTQMIQVPAGADQTATFTLTNTRTVPCSYTVLVEPATGTSPGRWTGAPVAMQTPVLPAGGATTVSVILRAPRALGPATGTVLVSARADLDGSTRVYSIITASRTPCSADFNGAGGITVQDIFDYLALWFAGDERADLNASIGLDVQDIFDFLAAWFAGCP